jgi:hypothetical protein
MGNKRTDPFVCQTGLFADDPLDGLFPGFLRFRFEMLKCTM